MRSEVPDHSVFVRYLLGELPDEESRELEEVCFEDDAVHELLEAVEVELTDEYVRGELRGERRLQFERRVLGTSSRNRKIELSRLLTGVKPQPRRLNQSAIRIVAVAAGLVVAVSGGWFLLTRPQPKPIETAEVRVPLQPQAVTPAPQVETKAPPRPVSRAAVPPVKPNKQFDKSALVARSAPVASASLSAPAAPAPQPPPPPARVERPANAAISGRVVDPSGAVVVGAAVTLVDRSTGALKQGSTDAEGRYTLSELPAGKYDLKVHKAGFQEAVKTNLELASADRAQSDFDLSVGQSSSTVEVTAETATVQTSSAQSSVTIESRQLRDLPSLGRDATKLAFHSGGTGLTNSLKSVLGPSITARQLYQQMIAARGEINQTRVSRFAPTERSLLIEFSEPVLTGVTQADAKEAIALGLGGKPMNGSLEEAAANLAAYLNETCCGNSITAATIKVTGPSGPITGGLSVSPDRRAVTFVPQQPFEPGVFYRLSVENVKDATGRLIKKKFNKAFSIKP